MNRDDINLSLGKVPPQDIPIEEVVLGAMLIETNAIHSIIHELFADVFYKDNHKEICQAIIDLYNDSEKIDLLTVTDHLRKKEKLEFVGGVYYMTELTSKVNSAAHIEKHVLILKEKWLKRELIRTSQENLTRAYDDKNDVFEDLDNLQSSLMGLSENIIGVENPEIKQATYEYFKSLETAKKENKVFGMPTGFLDLDRASGGLVPTDLMIIAARPGMGKTAFILSIIKYISIKEPIGIFSLEMSKEQLLSRLVCAESRVNYEKFRRPKELSKDELLKIQTAASFISDLNLYIYDKGGMGFQELRSRAIMLKKKYGIKALFIDYLQLMKMMTGISTNDAVGLITKSLKSLAKELDIPIILLSQLSRKVEDRGGDKKPQLHDLRDSGNIEQDADIVIFIYRAEYYGFQPTDQHGQNLPEGTTELIFAKHRHGATGLIKMIFKPEYMAFYDFVNPETGEYKPGF